MRNLRTPDATFCKSLDQDFCDKNTDYNFIQKSDIQRGGDEIFGRSGPEPFSSRFKWLHAIKIFCVQTTSIICIHERTYAQTISTCSESVWIWMPTNVAATKIAAIIKYWKVECSATALYQHENSVWNLVQPRNLFSSTWHQTTNCKFVVPTFYPITHKDMARRKWLW